MVQHWYGFESESSEGYFPRSQPAPTLSRGRASQSEATMESQLWGERWLNRLGDRLQQVLLTPEQGETLTPATSAESPAEFPVHPVYPIWVDALQEMLGPATIAIALPAANQTVPAYQIHYLSPPPQTGRDAQGARLQLPDQASQPLSLGEILPESLLQTLQQQTLCSVESFADIPKSETSRPDPALATLPQWVWTIGEGELQVGWLIAIAPTPSFSPTLQLDLIRRSARQVALVLAQVKRWQASCDHRHQLELQNRELIKSNRLKSEFLANTSHEIRTPLSSILGFTHLLREQTFNPGNQRHQEYLNIILSSGQHLLALINDILDLSKIEANQLDLQWETIEVADLCRSALALVKEKAQDKGLKFQLDLDPAATTLEADPLRLKQMLFNLLSNALKFTGKGSVGLQVKAQNDFLHFTVWDTGTGISPEEQKRLFRPYVQIANATTSGVEGTGLGLALTQKLAELHHGWIEVQSVVNQGSRFTIVLPRTPKREAAQPDPLPSMTAAIAASQAVLQMTAQGPDTSGSESGSAPCSALRPLGSPTSPKTAGYKPAPTPLSLSSHAAAPANSRELAWNPSERRNLRTVPGGKARTQGLSHRATRHPMVLLVEDNLPNGKLITMVLQKSGYEVTWVKQASEMWQVLHQVQPAVILMDIYLPDEDGLTLIYKLQSSAAYRTIPIIAQTAMAMSGDRDVCLAAGATDYISKPINFETLKQLVDKYSHCDRPSRHYSQS